MPSATITKLANWNRFKKGSGRGIESIKCFKRKKLAWLGVWTLKVEIMGLRWTSRSKLVIRMLWRCIRWMTRVIFIFMRRFRKGFLRKLLVIFMRFRLSMCPVNLSIKSNLRGSRLNMLSHRETWRRLTKFLCHQVRPSSIQKLVTQKKIKVRLSALSAYENVWLISI